jgi:multidrug efflux pump subunit AcrA (membrane-fusion protein)
MRLLQNLAALLVVAAAGSWAYYSNVVAKPHAMDMSARMTGNSNPFPVVLAAVAQGPIQGTVTYTGSVAADTEEDVYPRVTGRIVELPVYSGDRVQSGQVVARLDDAELSSRAREAAASAAGARAGAAQMEADALAARHGLAQMEREVAMARADLAAARANVMQMERELDMVRAEAAYQESFAEREERLFKSGAVSRQDTENARSMKTASLARVQAALAKVEQGKAMAGSAEARLGAAEARLEQGRAMEAAARKKLDVATAMIAQSDAAAESAAIVQGYATIVASASGYVVKRLVAPGVLVQPGTPILKIAATDRVRLQANVGERDLAGIRVGSPVQVALPGTGGDPFTATVTSVFPFVEPGARTAVVEAVVANAGRRLLPGQYVQMQFVTGAEPDTLSVPREAVLRSGEIASVWVARDGRVERRQVTTGLENRDRIEIVAGLDAGERVVRRGVEGLYAGARVADVAAGPLSAAGHAGHGGKTPASSGPAATSAGPSPSPAGPGAPAHTTPGKSGGGHGTHKGH